MVGLGRRRPCREKSSPGIGQKAAVDLKDGHENAPKPAGKWINTEKQDWGSEVGKSTLS